ncbi:uncharacterized protein BX664DRAFT_358398 [Halteromyces radiatus]|uniref:uncharacterized protein n=1 Tax=Halteromyces radiatus TaxID=101107 RepID=UPI00221EBAB0|nr:uncharacterized protein BX664DRAFT_358398 [Halteromyces radiatus]KAI8088753.1 hypothetical protein BX664DRAFT_358398 [Halteromyces radiatus]
MLWSDSMYPSNPPVINDSLPNKINTKASFATSRHQQQDKKLIKKRKSQSSKYMDDEEKRKNFLERNRQAALKCRQRKKQWLNNLQAKVEYLTNDNEQLQIQSNIMRDELIQLRNVLWVHKDCHPNKHATLKFLNRPLPPGQPIMMPPPFTSHSLINNGVIDHSIGTTSSISSSSSSSSLSPSISSITSSSSSGATIAMSSTNIIPSHQKDYMAIQYSSTNPAALLLPTRSDMLHSSSPTS